MKSSESATDKQDNSTDAATPPGSQKNVAQSYPNVTGRKFTKIIALNSAPASLHDGYQPGGRRHIKDFKHRLMDNVPWWEKQAARMEDMMAEPRQHEGLRHSVDRVSTPTLLVGNELHQTVSHSRLPHVKKYSRAEHPATATTHYQAPQPANAYDEKARDESSDSSTEIKDAPYVDQALLDKVKASENTRVPWMKTSSVDTFSEKLETGVGTSNSNPELEDEIIYMNTKAIRDKYIGSDRTIYQNVDQNGQPLVQEEQEQNEDLIW